MKHLRTHPVVVACVLAAAWVVRAPFGEWEFGGYDRSWVIGFAVRLYRTSFFDFATRVENFFIQVLSHRGGFEIFPTWAWVGLSTVAGLPLTARNFQMFHATLQVTTLFLLYLLLRRLLNQRVALVALSIAAVLPSNVFASLYPMTTEWTLFLMVLGFVGVERLVVKQSLPMGALASLAFVGLTLSSRTFLVEYAAVTVLGGYLAVVRPWRQGQGLAFGQILRLPIVWLVWLPMTMGVLFQVFLYYHWVIQVAVPWGMLNYLLDHAKKPSTAANIATFLRDLIFFNGVLVPLAIFGALAACLVRARRVSALELFLAFLGLLYFLPSLAAQPRIDYGSMYFTPWAILLAIGVAHAWNVSGWPRVVAATVAAYVVLSAVWGLHTVRGIGWERWDIPGSLLRYDYEDGVYPETAWFLALNDDDHMKALGYWIREHVPENDQVGLYGGYWQLWTLEIYSGRSLAKNKRDLGFGTMRPGDAGALQVSYQEPRFHYAALLHTYVGRVEVSTVIEPAYLGNRDFIEGMLRYRKVGEITHKGRPVVSIYSDRDVPFARIDTDTAGPAWDRKYANLKSLAVSPYIGQAMNY